MENFEILNMLFGKREGRIIGPLSKCESFRVSLNMPSLAEPCKFLSEVSYLNWIIFSITLIIIAVGVATTYFLFKFINKVYNCLSRGLNKLFNRKENPAGSSINSQQFSPSPRV